MIIKRIKEVLNYILADRENLLLQNRLFLYSIILGIFICIVGTIIGLFAAESFTTMYIVALLVTCLLFIIYYFVRFKRIVKPCILPFIIISFIGISMVWILGGGINSSVLMIGFVVLILDLIIVPDRNMKYIISSFILMLIILFLIQLYRPDLIINYSSETDRWVDSLLTTIYSSFFIYLIIRFLLKQYTIERRRAEERGDKLLQLNASKDRFVSILSHDLKSPFSTLLGLSELLTDDIRKLDVNEIEDIAININKSARNTYNLLEDILVWARAQQGIIPFKPQKMNLINICKNAVEVLKPNTYAKSITINCSAEGEINIFADIEMLKTILRNLVSNAIKFTNKNGVININAEENSGNVTISVSDNGIGIKPDNLSKLFDISQVLTTTGTAKETGTGLGLLLCKEFVEKHGGEIWAKSEYGKDSEFKFTIPLFIEQVT